MNNQETITIDSETSSSSDCNLILEFFTSIQPRPEKTVVRKDPGNKNLKIRTSNGKETELEKNCLSEEKSLKEGLLNDFFEGLFNHIENEAEKINSKQELTNFLENKIKEIFPNQNFNKEEIELRVDQYLRGDKSSENPIEEAKIKLDHIPQKKIKRKKKIKKIV